MCVCRGRKTSGAALCLAGLQGLMGDANWATGTTGQAALICAWFSFKVCVHKIPDAIFDFIVSKRIGKQSARKKNKQQDGKRQTAAESREPAATNALRDFGLLAKTKTTRSQMPGGALKRGEAAVRSVMHVCVSVYWIVPNQGCQCKGEPTANCQSA